MGSVLGECRIKGRLVRAKEIACLGTRKTESSARVNA